MAQKKTTSKKGKAASKKGKAASYRLNKEGKLVGPNGRRVTLETGDTPIIINGGSLTITAFGELDDDDNPGHKTHQLHASDDTKHITFIQLIGFSATPMRLTPVTTDHRCTIMIHYA